MADLRLYATWARTAAFARRVERARALLRSTIGERDQLAVSCSWGKDSVALAALALETLGAERVVVVHLASAYELPGYDEVIAWLRARCEVVVLPATRTLDETIEWLREVGLCFERGMARGNPAARAKRDAVAEWCREHAVTARVLGLRAEEKGPRAKLIRARGPVIDLVDGTRQGLPLAYWSSRDVWAYHAAASLPYNRRLYDAETHGYTRETIRNCGWLTTVGAARGQLAWLRYHFPEQWRALTDAFPQTRALS